jgi:hypothetical protein
VREVPGDHGPPGRVAQAALWAARKGEMVVRKFLMFAIAAGAGWLLYTQRQDIIRYAKIKQMSMGDGHPENVPAAGSPGYPTA